MILSWEGNQKETHVWRVRKRTSHGPHCPVFFLSKTLGGHLLPFRQLVGAHLPWSHSKRGSAGLTTAPPSTPEPWGLGNTCVPASLFSPQVALHLENRFPSILPSKTGSDTPSPKGIRLKLKPRLSQTTCIIPLNFRYYFM